jgi:hypothetical protein
MMAAFLAESCQGGRTQGQQSVLKIAKSTVEVHLVWHDIYVATETGRQIRTVVYYSMRLRKSDRETAGDLHHDAQIIIIISSTAHCEPRLPTESSSTIPCPWQPSTNS